MMDINEVITELNNIKKGDIIFMKKHDYISGNCEKVRPHIIIDIIDGYCGGALVMPFTSHYKIDTVPILTNPSKNIVSYAIPFNMVLIPLSDIKKCVKSNEYVSTVDERLCDGLKLIYMVNVLKYKPTDVDKDILDYMIDYLSACNKCKDKYTNVYGKKIPYINLDILNKYKENNANKEKEIQLLTQSILKCRIYKSCNNDIIEYVHSNVELYVNGELSIENLAKMLSISRSLAYLKVDEVKKELVENN